MSEQTAQSAAPPRSVGAQDAVPDLHVAPAAVMEALSRSSLLAGLPAEMLGWLGSQATSVTLAPGEVLMRQGDPSDSVYIVVSGSLDVAAEVGDSTVPVAVSGPGASLGELGVIAGNARNATVTAREDVELLRIDGEAFGRLLDSPMFARRLLVGVSDRLEQRQLLTQQHSKMAALGQLTAGLLHELNNPTAVLRRNAAALRERLAQWRAASEQVGPEHAAVARAIVLAARPAAAPADPLDRSDAEQRVQRWLTDRGVVEAWALAPVIVAQGLDVGSITEATAGVGDAGPLDRILELACAALDVDSLLEGLLTGAQRIEETVAAVRGYSHHGEAPVQDVILTEGVEQALRLLAHKVTEDVRIVRDYDSDLPKVEGYPGDLNSVWTNLIDNALDSVGDAGTVTLRTRREGGMAVVEVIDDGPGIPPEVVPRVFDPFFTTKPIGQGTGVGLALVHTIVVQRHRGDISVASEPGRTTFRVQLPLWLRRPG